MVLVVVLHKYPWRFRRHAVGEHCPPWVVELPKEMAAGPAVSRGIRGRCVPKADDPGVR